MPRSGSTQTIAAVNVPTPCSDSTNGTTHPPRDPRRWAERRALSCLFVGAAAIGFAPILTVLSQQHAGVGPTTAAFWRVALAFPAFWLWLWARRNTAGQEPSHGNVGDQHGGAASRWWLLTPGLLFACDLGAWHYSINWAGVANATLLANFATVLVVLAGWFWFRERFGGLFVLGALLALAGVAVLLGADFHKIGQGKQLRGDALGLLTAVFYAGYLLSIKQLRRRHSTVSLMAWSSTVCAIVLLPAALLSGEQFMPRGATGWLMLLGLAYVSHAGGQGLIAFALAHLSASFSAVSLLVQPLTAALLGWVILSQALGPLQAVGGAVVLLGILLARLGSRETQRPPRVDTGQQE